MKLLTIAILSSNRKDLLQATINSLLNTITYPHWELVVYNHDGSIGQGWNSLYKRMQGEYVLMCQDDWFFMEKKWDWLQECIQVLDEVDDLGIIRLRKDNDGQAEESIGKRILFYSEEKKLDFKMRDVACVGGGFTLNPFVCKKALIGKLGEVAGKRKIHGLAEMELRDRYKAFGYKTFKLDNDDGGVCIHIGRGRRCK